MTTTKKTAKLEEYGPRAMPLIRSAAMTDAQWAAAKRDIVATTRRAGGPAVWVKWIRKHVPTCPQCGTDKGPFGPCSGLCPKCGDATRAALLKSVGL